jgi:hypothetical protein
MEVVTAACLRSISMFVDSRRGRGESDKEQESKRGQRKIVGGLTASGDDHLRLWTNRKRVRDIFELPR